MPALSSTDLQWCLIALLVIFNLVSAVRVAVYMRRMRRPALRWFFITLCFTAIPYLAYALYHNFAWLLSGQAKTPAGPGRRDGRSQERPWRCPHCGALVGPGEFEGAGLAAACPRCGTALEEETHA